jgi:hypothetical protein
MDWIKKYKSKTYNDSYNDFFVENVSGKRLSDLKYKYKITEDEFLSGEYLTIAGKSDCYISIEGVIDMTIENRKRKLNKI